MEKGKRLRSISEEKKPSDRIRRANISQERKVKDLKDSFQPKGKTSSNNSNKPSLIPVPKVEKTEPKTEPKSEPKSEPKNVHQKQRKCYSSSKLSCVSTACSKPEKRYEDFDTKLKLLEEKEKSIAQYYLKVEDLIRKLAESEQLDNEKSLKPKQSRNSEARKMTSEPLVFSRNRTSADILTDLESNVQQISKIWVQASNDLSSTVKHLKSNPSLDPMEFELEKVRLQLAIKQTKSLTLVKTRDILAEAKKLFRHREMIRMELENIINHEKSKEAKCKCFKEEIKLEEKNTNTSLEIDNKQNVDGTGDTPKEESDLESQENTTCNETSDREKGAAFTIEEESSAANISKQEESSSEEKISEENSNKEVEIEKTGSSTPIKQSDVEALAREMSKKNETIATLNNKIFELQKTCNEQSHKCCQLQVALAQFSEKIQWNYVLWKQIGKLKEQIKGLQQNNKHLESQKRELECKIIKLDSELDRLIKLNHFLNQRKYLLHTHETFDRECSCMDYRRGEDSGRMRGDKYESEKSAGERILAEKQNAINQLKTILSVMKDQENFAQRQITVFQNKIEELERNTKS